MIVVIMNIFNGIKQNFFNGIGKVFHAPLWMKILLLAIIVAGCIFFGKSLIGRFQTKTIQYQTTKAAKGTLTTTVTGTGTISSGNSTNISTAATGTINEVYVINSQKITKGDKIASMTLDEYGLQQQAYYYAKYIDAIHTVKEAEAAKDGYDIDMWQARQAILDAEDNINTKNLNPTNPSTGKDWTLSERTVVDKTLEKAKKTYDAAEFKYKNADADIVKAQNDVTAALKNYQLVSSTIYAPATGTVNNLSLAKGVVISSSSTTITTSQSSSNSTTITSQTLGKIYDLDAQMQASVSLTESDIINIAPNQKVTLTLDAYEGKTFTGKVLAVDTSGSVSSGVTTYPVTILMDKTSVSIYPNMAASVTIITSIKTNVLLIDTSSIDTENNKSVVHVLKNGKASSVEVTIGSADDTQTEITKGLSEGDVVITNYVSASDPSQNNTSSAFSSASKTSSKSSNKSSSGSIGIGGGMGGGPPGM